ncbi:MAG: selenide, water dikinase SelD [Candidatus Obscuribacter sp.]|nr:selenide, water dikinase SelD [Candidatus Melainabacteria bacterium]MDX1990353.1 selenide, water dikinase SelD [Candidatus Obscuribacter sp.]
MSNNNPKDLSSNDKRLTSNVKAAGCAAKMSSAELKQVLAGLPKIKSANLLAGIDNFEDAAVYKLNDDLAMVKSMDFFPPVLDDPYLFGQIAATNALSDIYAMGGKPTLALAMLVFPTCDLPLSTAAEILRGGADQVEKAGAIIAGGHSIQGAEVLYGLSVTGFVHPEKLLTNSGARAGDQIVMTKSLGTGVGLLALKAGLLDDDTKGMLVSSLTTLNDRAIDALAHLGTNTSHYIHACTDITGFGLIGHIQEMSKASKVSATINIKHLRFLPGVLEFARQGLVPAAAYGNRKSFETNVSYIKDFPLEFTDLLYDPQTAGGLIFAVADEHAEACLKALNGSGVAATIIGQFLEGIPGHIDITMN